MAQAIGIIPARYGSTRFPGKPLALIDGLPMVQHVYRRAMKARRLRQVVVATDDRRILDCVHGFGGEAVMTSPRHRSGTDRAAEVMGRYEFRNSRYRIVVNIQGDEPLVDPRAIDRLVAGLEGSPGSAMATLVGRFADRRELQSPHTVKVVLDGRGDALYFSRSAIPFARGPGRLGLDQYYKHIGLYAYRRDFLRQFCSWGPGQLERIEQLEQLRALEHGARIRCLAIGRGWPAVDTPQDLAKLSRSGRAL